jgi:hypothetical protein
LAEYARLARITVPVAKAKMKRGDIKSRKWGAGYQIQTGLPDRPKRAWVRKDDQVKVPNVKIPKVPASALKQAAAGINKAAAGMRAPSPPTKRQQDKRAAALASIAESASVSKTAYAPAEIDETKEVRIVNETTGGAKGQKDIAFDLIPWEQMQEVAKLYHFGSKKYSPGNWCKGFAWSLSFAAMMRHATQFWMGESVDEETQCSHLASVVFHALALMYFEKHHPGLDDRPGQLHLFGE